MFEKGDILMFSEAGLHQWGGPNPPDRYRKWRFLVIRVEDKKDLEGNSILRIERLDLPSHRRESWSSVFFEKVQ